MKTFYQWAEKRRLDLPVLSEKASRAGFAHWAYPDAYIRQQYPDGWFMPHAADALHKMGDHQPNRKAPSDNAP